MSLQSTQIVQNTYDPNSAPTTSHPNEQTTSFEEATSAVVGPPISNFGTIQSTSSDICHFLARPIFGETYSWVGATLNSTTYSAAATWRSSVYPIKKVSGFQNMRGRFMVKAVLDGIPQNYGRLLIALVPYYAQQGSVDSTHFPPIRARQLTHGLLDPSTSSGVTLALPWAFPLPYIDISNTGDFTKLVTVFVKPLVALQRADGAAVTTVNVQFFYWWEDVVVVTPTNYVAASGKAQEPTTSVKPSSIAGTVASAAAVASRLPLIGPAFNVLSQVAGGVESVLAFFGFSRPVEPSTMVSNVSRYMDTMAVTDVKDLAQSLAVTGSCSNAMDERYGRGVQKDPLALLTIASIPSQLGAFDWTVARVTGDLLMAFPVNPCYCHITGTTAYTLSATGFVASNFAFWSGSLIFHIEVVCSPFHKGRLLIYHQPALTAPAAGDPTPYTLTNNCVLDVSAQTSVDFLVTNQQVSPLLRTHSTELSASGGGPAAFIDAEVPPAAGAGYDNGFLVVKVVTPLVAPAATATASLLVTVRAGADFACHGPTSAFWRNTNFLAASGILQEPAPVRDANHAMEFCNLVEPIYISDDADLLVGERVVSLRQLIKRYEWEGYAPCKQAAASVAGATYAQAVDILTDPTPSFWWDGTTTSAFNAYQQPWVYTNTLLARLAACHVGYRGSVRLKLIPRSNIPSTIDDYTVSRIYYVGQPPDVYGANVWAYDVAFSNVNLAPGAGGAYSAAKWTFFKDGLAGIAITNDGRTLEVQIPYTDQLLFHSPKPLAISVPGLQFGKVRVTREHHQQLSIDLAATGFEVYRAAGDDFNFFNWIGCPPLNYALNPVEESQLNLIPIAM